MGGRGGCEWHPSSAARLHGVRLSVADTGVCVPQVGSLSKGEEWVWQGALSHVGGGSVPSNEARGTVGVGSGVCLLLGVCLVVLSLLLMAGDVERNPGPTDKEGTQLDCCFVHIIMQIPVNCAQRILIPTCNGFLILCAGSDQVDKALPSVDDSPLG